MKKERCINCRAVFKAPYVARHYYGYYGADGVGPFCEACDATIKVHTGFVAKESAPAARPPEEPAP